MHIVAIHNLPDNKETLAAKLAVTMGATVYESLSRLRTPGKGPLVVGVFAAIGPAEELLMKLGDAAFDAVLLKEDEVETEARQFIVRKFSLEKDTLLVKSRDEATLSIPYRSMDLIVRGTSIEQTVSTVTVKEKKFDPGMALLTSGLKMTKTIKKVSESTAQTREGFFLLYAEDHKTLVFRESGLVYDSLGTALRPTRQGNFSYLLEELRRNSTKALYDDRLLSRAGQFQLLGRSLNPEEHLPIATALLAKSLRTTRRPAEA